jgi:CzcA family heavy metal efflux pump
MTETVKDAFPVRHRQIILFVAVVLCAAGVFAAFTMPSSVFPKTDFPRVVVLIDNGVMPADEMMATVTRPVEEAMKDIPGTVNIRSATARGSAEIDVFFEWNTDMVQAELAAMSHMAQIRGELPAEASYEVHRLTFSSFPILGISLTSPKRSGEELWKWAQYELKPRLLRVSGVARAALVGGREPEYQVVVDPTKLAAHHLSLDGVAQSLADSNVYVPAGMHEENHQLYLTLVDGRVKRGPELARMPVGYANGTPVYVQDIGEVRLGAVPQYTIVTADGVDAVLLNLYGQPGTNVLGIAAEVKQELAQLKRVRSVWESIVFGLALSALVLFLFLRSPGMTGVAVLAIPITILATLAMMRALDLSFNIMTLGGIAAAIGLVIDDAIVVVEAIHANIAAGSAPKEAVRQALHEVGPALVGSTLTPVVVFLPLTTLEGVPGVFFRSLALTMASSLLISLALAVTLTPSLAARLGRRKSARAEGDGPVLRRVVAVYERAVTLALRRSGLTLACMGAAVALGALLYFRMESDFLPAQDEGAFVLDYLSRPGTSLSETDRMLRNVENIIRATPEVESYSRRTGTELGLTITEPNSGDFLIKLRANRGRNTEEVIEDIREKVSAAEPGLQTEFPGILSDLIGDLTWSPDPIEIRLFSTDTEALKSTAARVAELIESVPGVVDVNDGVIVAGPSLIFRIRPADAARAGFTTAQVGSALDTALQGKLCSHVLEGDRPVGVRVMLAPQERESDIAALPILSQGERVWTIGDVADIEHEAGLLEMHREDQRELVAVSARLAGRDLRSGIADIKRKLDAELKLPPGMTLEYGGLYQQQQESFRSLTRVLLTAVLLVFGVLIVEFRAFRPPLAIVAGSALALTGVVGALWLTGISLNIVSFLSAIIGFGIVAKNGILMLDRVDRLRAEGLSLRDALVLSGRRRLRPVLMTSLTAFFGLLPLAYGVGAGADMLRPLAIGVIGALAVSLLLSLVATPVLYYVLASRRARS